MLKAEEMTNVKHESSGNRSRASGHPNCAELGEVLETVKVIDESDVQSWYTAWKDTADRVVALAERTQDPLSKGGAYMRASTYQRAAEFLIPPDDPKRPESFEKTGSYFIKGLGAS